MIPGGLVQSLTQELSLSTLRGQYCIPRDKTSLVLPWDQVIVLCNPYACVLTKGYFMPSMISENSHSSQMYRAFIKGALNYDQML